MRSAPARRQGSPAAAALRVAGLALRAATWVLALLVVADAVLPAGARTYLLGLNGAVTRLVPGALSGLFVFQTPLGGAFRGDFAALAIVLLVLDCILSRASASLRRG